MGKLVECIPDWCRISVEGEKGWLPQPALWGVKAFVPAEVSGEMWPWVFLGPFFGIAGGLAALAAFDLDWGTAVAHFSLYVIFTALLRWLAAAQESAELPGLEVSRISIRPSGAGVDPGRPGAGSGGWNMDVDFTRWERRK